MKSCRIIHLPDYHKKNPYQSLLLKNLTDIGFDVGFGIRKVYFSNIDLSILFNLFKNCRVDILHLHWQHPFFVHNNRILMIFRCFLFVFQLVFIKIFGVKIVWTVHNLKNHDNTFIKIETFFSRIISKIADALIVHCKASMNEIIKLFKINGNKVFVIPHGNYLNVYREKLTRRESKELLDLADSDFVFLFLGFVRPYKGIVELIESFKKIDDQSVKLIIAGRIRDKKFHHILKKRTESNNNIFLESHHIDDDEIEIYMKAADVMVLPYRDIISSGSAILGMSFGKVIIVPRLGCIPEILKSEGGILYDPKEKNGLLKAMKLALASKNKIFEMGKSNSKLAKKMEWKDIAASTGNVYFGCRGK